MDVGIGISNQKDILSALNEALWQAKSQLGKEKPSIGFLFASPEFSSPSLLKTLRIYLPDTPIVGASTLAVLFNYKIYRHTLAICLLHSENLKISLSVVKDIEKKTALVAGEELGINLIQNFREEKRGFAMTFTTGPLENGSNLIRGLQKILGTSFPLVGACASDNLKFKQTYIYFNDELLTDAAVGILFGGKIIFSLSSRHGWKPIGKIHRVTQSKGNLLQEINGQSAVSLYENYFARDITSLKSDLKYISTLYPIGIYLEGEEEYLLRNILFIENDGSLVCQGDIPEESIIRLMIGTKDSCLYASQQATEELIREFFSSTLLLEKKLSIIFIFDSTSRYILLRRLAEIELQNIHNVIQKSISNNLIYKNFDIPIIGLYTYGEQAPLKSLHYYGATHLH
ncbi:MAG: FIST C-terminal domain-containing protein, partial [Candidatus Omnitrophica bacterium]|nr:FIST C-terminal domain-containing protein [Candidatus Omnitrophota bacterium]